MYNETIIDHFTNPRHLGNVSEANGVGTIGDPDCGDFMRISVRVDNDIIEDVSFLCQGCPAAIACGSATCEMAIGKSIREAVAITEETITEYLGGLPGEKVHCSNLGVGALRYAVADYLGIRVDGGNTSVPAIERLRNAAVTVATQSGMLDASVVVETKKSPDEPAAENAELPILKRKERTIEARIENGIGQAYSPVPTEYSGTVNDVLSLDLSGCDEAAVKNRGVFTATVNAMCAHLGIAAQTIHCGGDGPKECAGGLLCAISAGCPDDCRITIVGYQPEMIESIAPSYSLRVVDLDPDNIGKQISGITVESEEQTEDALQWCNIALVTGSTLVNGTIDQFTGLKCHTVFYGVTIAGAAALLRLHKFCIKGL